jgi:hypothetical protein
MQGFLQSNLQGFMPGWFLQGFWEFLAKPADCLHYSCTALLTARMQVP